MKKTTKSICIIFLLLTLSVNLLFLGGQLNKMVKEFNEGRMPVKTSTYIESSRHFSYTNNHEVSFWIFSDIFKGFGWIWSIGDVMIYLGFSSFFCTLSISNIFLLKEISKIIKK